MKFPFISKNKTLSEYQKHRKTKLNSSFCFAPFNTLEFHISGQVRVCCANRYKIVGNYPNQSIQEIWENISIIEFRKRLINNDLSDGCHGCDKMLKLKNYANLTSLDYDIFQTNRKAVLKNIKFELSNECNLECEMCWGELSSSIRKNIEKLPKINNIYNENFIPQLKPFWKNIEKATFLGGEPFLIKTYYTIWEEINKYNSKIKILIVTNGTIINENIKQLISKGNFYFAVSIDSFQKETYEKIRKNAIFEKTMLNFEYLYQYSKGKKHWITINVCPMQQNWKEIPAMINEMNKRDINVFFNPVDFPSSHSLRGLPSQKIIEIYNYFKSATIVPYINDASIQNSKMFLGLILQTKLMFEEIKQYEDSEIHKIKTKLEAENFLLQFFKNNIATFHCSKTTIDENIIKIKEAFSILKNESSVKGVKSILRLPNYLLISEIIYTTSEKLAVRLQQSFKNGN